MTYFVLFFHCACCVDLRNIFLLLNSAPICHLGPSKLEGNSSFQNMMQGLSKSNTVRDLLFCFVLFHQAVKKNSCHTTKQLHFGCRYLLTELHNLAFSCQDIFRHSRARVSLRGQRLREQATLAELSVRNYLL